MLMNYQQEYLFIKTKQNLDPQFSEQIFICHHFAYGEGGRYKIAKGKFRDKIIPFLIVDRELTYNAVMESNPEFTI